VPSFVESLRSWYRERTGTDPSTDELEEAAENLKRLALLLARWSRESEQRIVREVE